MAFLPSLNIWLRKSISVKLLIIGFIILILLIPTFMLGALIKEREGRQNETVSEVSSKWGRSQTIGGPILVIPYFTLDKTSSIKMTQYAYFLPKDLNIEGEIMPQMLHRGIYDIVAYNSNLNLAGSFAKLDFSDWNIPAENILWSDAFVSLGIPDLRGIKENIDLSFDDKTYTFESGVRTLDVINSGVSTDVKLNPASDKDYNFSFNLKLNGSYDLNFLPLGKETNVELKSKWPSPSFSGEFLPDNREVTKDGFSSSWKVLDMNRNYPQKWLGRNYEIDSSAFGVELIVPVDQYQKAFRSIKYALMIIFLTFLVFFFVEIKYNMRFHPFQYILVGVALIIFYALLLSLSEHIAFNLAYLIGSVATIGLIGLYSLTMFKKNILTMVLSSILVVLYVFVFSILQLEDYALLMGSIFLFLILAVIMYMSRNIKWYQEEEIVEVIKEETIEVIKDENQ